MQQAHGRCNVEKGDVKTVDIKVVKWLRMRVVKWALCKKYGRC